MTEHSSGAGPASEDDPNQVDDLIGSIMDGKAVDWQGMKPGPGLGDGEEQSMAALEELARIAEFHRRLQHPDLSAPGAALPPASPVAPGAPRPMAFRLHAATPNPFAVRTLIAFDLPTSSPVRLAIHGESGEHVKTLVDEPLMRGPHVRVWNRTDENGKPVSPGVYVVRLMAETRAAEEKLTVLPDGDRTTR